MVLPSRRWLTNRIGFAAHTLGGAVVLVFVVGVLVPRTPGPACAATPKQYAARRVAQPNELLTNAKKVTVSVLYWYTSFPARKSRIFFCHFFLSRPERSSPTRRAPSFRQVSCCAALCPGALPTQTAFGAQVLRAKSASGRRSFPGVTCPPRKRVAPNFDTLLDAPVLEK